eukprot:29357-Rhodomonas_salina.1
MLAMLQADALTHRLPGVDPPPGAKTLPRLPDDLMAQVRAQPLGAGHASDLRDESAASLEISTARSLVASELTAVKAVGAPEVSPIFARACVCGSSVFGEALRGRGRSERCCLGAEESVDDVTEMLMRWSGADAVVGAGGARDSGAGPRARFARLPPQHPPVRAQGEGRAGPAHPGALPPCSKQPNQSRTLCRDTDAVRCPVRQPPSLPPSLVLSFFF